MSVTDAMREELAADYAAMAEMFMEEPPAFDELVSRLADIEARINAVSQAARPVGTTIRGLKETRWMEFDDQMRRFFGTDDLGAVSPAALASGVERMQVEFGLETGKGRKFAMWSLLYMLGAAPDLEAAFKGERDRDAARTFMDLLDRANAA